MTPEAEVLALKEQLLNLQAMYLAQGRELNALQTERVERGIAELAKEKRALARKR